MVIYRTGDGQPGYHQTEELNEAVRYVEQLRNGDGVDGARIFRMEEVNFDFRPYFKVEIGPTGEPIHVPVPQNEQPAPAPMPAAPAMQPEAEPTPLVGSAPAAPAPVEELADAWGALGADTPAEVTPLVEEPADAWGALGADTPAEVTPLVEKAASFMPEAEPVETNGDHGDDGVGARRGLFGR
jgi:hypothetical protein